MAFMEWSKEFEFGIPEIDGQHKTWLEILNRFYDHIAEANLQDKMLEMVNEAYHYTLFHFQSEENFMARIHYPKINEQKTMHHAIVEKLKSFQSDIQSGKMLISTSVTKELKQWFREHILVEDKQYAEYLQTTSHK